MLPYLKSVWRVQIFILHELLVFDCILFVIQLPSTLILRKTVFLLINIQISSNFMRFLDYEVQKAFKIQHMDA